MAQTFRPAFAWALIAVLVAAFVAAFFSLQLGVFVLLFAAVGWWAWGNPEGAFWLLIILSPLLSMFKATQTIGTVTLIKDVLILVLFARTFLWPLLTKKLPYRRSILFGPAAALVAWTAFAALRADNLTLGILRAREIVLYLLLYFGVLYLDHSQEVWKARLKWVVATFLVTSVLAGYQWFFAADSAVLRFDPGRQIWIPRISSTFAHPSVYGEYLVAVAALFAAIGIGVRPRKIASRSRGKRWWPWILFVVTLPLIFLTYSRAVWVGFVTAGVAIGVMWVASLLHSRSVTGGYSPGVAKRGSLPAPTPGEEASSTPGERAKRWLVPGAGLAVLLVLLTLLRFTPAGPLLRSAFDPTYKSNLERFEFAIRLIASMSNVDALIGRGLGDVVAQNFRTVRVGVEEIAEGASRDIQLAKNRTLVDNQYLKSFVEMGLIGLVIYFWLFWRFLKGAWQTFTSLHLRSVSAVISLWSVGFLAAFVVQGLFIDIWDIFPSNAMFWIVGGLLSAALTPYPKSHV